MNLQNFFLIVQHHLYLKKFLNCQDLLKQRMKLIFIYHFLFPSLFVFSRPLGRMLLSFLNKDPISAAQQTANMNNNFSNSSMHTIPEHTNSNTKLNNIPARENIIPIMDKVKPRVDLIEQLCNRTLSTNEKELLNDINILFQPNPSYSPMLTREHVVLLSK